LGLLAATLLAHRACGVTVQEDFSTNPASRGWQVHGESSLFAWDSTHEVLRVTWDSSKTNSYFHLPLRTELRRSDDFTASFDIRLEDISAGTTPGKPREFPLVLSLFNLADAQRTNLFVGYGVTPSGGGVRNAVEFNYFPDAGYGETFAAIAVSSTPTNYGQFQFHHDYPTPMETGIWHRVTLSCSGASQQVTLTKTRAGLPYGATQTLSLAAPFGDFRLDTLAISSYCDQVGLGSVQAHGVIDNISLTVPDPPISTTVLTLTNGLQVHFQSTIGWNYRLQRNSESAGWVPASSEWPGTGGLLSLTDTNAPAGSAFYRVLARRP
jgi:hypothetical protein